MSTSLNAARRVRDLAAATDEIADVLVVGLGVTGAGVALDAAARGLKVTAIDAHDLAFGTSRWSSKLVHGGLRYLASGQVDVARESAIERGVLMTRTAPHLTRRMPFVLPLTPLVPRRNELLTSVGLHAGDLLRRSAGTPRGVLPGPSRLSAAATLRSAPVLRAAGLRGGLLSWDGQLHDDARLVTAIARTAAGRGARILTRCRALEVTGEGVRVRDELTGAEYDLRARKVVNAAGVWAGSLVPGITLRPSRGTHLVLDGTLFGGMRTGLHIPIPGTLNRFALVLPQDDGRVYVGLTDEPSDGIPDVPVPPESDIGFLLDVLGTVLDVQVRRSDVLGAFAGLRPLLQLDGKDAAAGATADISRRHAVLKSPDGVVTIVGGKLTTYRRMAEDAVDALGLAVPPSPTAQIPLVGAASFTDLARIKAPSRLVRRYGAEAAQMAELAADDPSLLEPVLTGRPQMRVEWEWAVRHEGALTAEDLVDRRTRLGLSDSDRARAMPLASGYF
ncbi:glycerol-3-phosphate dehydrogenase/oxidase [Actinocorallia sp. A-T 12471]|uniref:glycerol-3-phosphate dehydrogenase/oxidase n=1 Tax=Actinocorallia sp. A-T 12471 TaxID=3089813 RepID=UPI0029CD79B6|nr:glycerol-3-phosphate dehydrogenase/oxidase [Actinocorallia sp. A-T 12471]MDX6739506.1 glycerol-3-phosphate dehydrogenase/oxidase [Actinocorallia sp. A-T 12471]